MAGEKTKGKRNGASETSWFLYRKSREASV